MEIRAGSRLKSSVCQTEVIAVKAPGTEMDIRCGGVPMVDPTGSIPDDPSPLDAAMNGTQMGKRYVCLLYTSPSPRDKRQSRMPSSA